MSKHEHRIGPGAASLILVITVVGMSILGLMALIEARNNHSLSVRTMKHITNEYALSSKAQNTLSRIDLALKTAKNDAASYDEYTSRASALLPENVILDRNLIMWTEAGAGSRELICVVEIMPLESEARYTWREHRYSPVYDEEEMW